MPPATWSSVDLSVLASPVLASGLRLQEGLSGSKALAHLAGGADPRPQFGSASQARVAEHAADVLGVASQRAYRGAHGRGNVRAGVG